MKPPCPPASIALQVCRVAALSAATALASHATVATGQTVFAAGAATNSGLVETCPPQPKRLRLPKNTSKTTGLMVTIDTRWSEGYGYRPVRFEVTSPVPSTTDRTLQLRFRAHDWRLSRQDAGAAEKTIVLPAGQTSIETTLAVPKLFTWYFVSWEVIVDGVKDKALSREPEKFTQHPTFDFDAFVMLRPTRRGSSGVAGLSNALGLMQRMTQFGRAEGGFGGLTLALVEKPLPEDWLLYTSLDVVCMSADELMAAAEDHPAAFDALRRWVRTGGALWVEQTDRGFEKAAEVSELLGLGAGPRFALPEDAEGPLADNPEWRWRQYYWRDPSQGIDYSDAAIEAELNNRNRRGRLSSSGKFAQAEMGFGAVAVFERNWQRGSGSQSWQRDAFAGYWARRAWTQRHGMSPDAANADFSNFLVPGVGLAPVTEFQVLITLFVLVTGPLSFWVLSRRQRTHLMVLTVPITAAVLTAGLVAYALLADGFGVRARARSVTLLDQAAGEQTTWSRRCYYAGMAPRGGLAMPTDTAAYPILPGWNDFDALGTSFRGRSVRWGGGVQQLGRGWLPSRESTQMLTLQSAPTESRIDFLRRGDGLAATNRLGADAELLIVLDDRGGVWLDREVPQESRVTLTKSDALAASNAVRTLVTENLPAPPAGFEAASANPLLDQQIRRRRRQLRREIGVDYAAIAVGDNLLNQVLERLTGLYGSPPLALPPRSYVAITLQNCQTPLGLDDVDQQGGFHVTIGKW
ncbi:MAG: hypothetical protein AAF790_11910 [Planctomycetota bacterium]